MNSTKMDAYITKLNKMDAEIAQLNKDEYTAQLNEIDLIVLRVARQTLGSLFDLEKSRDYRRWLESNIHLSKEGKDKRVPTITTTP